VLTQIADFRKSPTSWARLLVVDTVASLAAVPLHVDRERVDIASVAHKKRLARAAGKKKWGFSPPGPNF